MLAKTKIDEDTATSTVRGRIWPTPIWLPRRLRRILILVAILALVVALALVAWRVPLALVTDIQLGQFNGLHLVLLAHQWSPSTAAFVYSADGGNNATRQEANGCGAIYVQKDDISSILVPKLLETLTQPNMD